MSDVVAVFAGSFDPPTLGHLRLIERASKMFDELHVVIAVNSQKQNLLSAEERLALFQELLKKEIKSKKVVVKQHDGLLVDYCKKVTAKVTVRGLRSSADFEYESQMAWMNQKLLPGLETVFLRGENDFQFLSSTLVREVAWNGGDLSSLLPDLVCKKILQSIAKKKGKKS